MNYELHMRAALSEAAAAGAAGELADGAVAVIDEAMVANARATVAATGDPTAHAVVNAIRGASRRMGRTSLAGVTVYAMVEPCAMCVGALLECDADGVVFALRDPVSGACGSSTQLAEAPGSSRRLRVVSGILRDDAAVLRPDLDLDHAPSRQAAGR